MKSYITGDLLTEVEVVPADHPDHTLPAEDRTEDDYALVIGDPWSTAYAIIDSLDGLEAWAQRILDEIRRARAAN